MLQGAYISIVIGMVGTSIAPWMQFYQQAAVVEKGITAKEVRAARVEVILSCILTSVIAFFIVVACAGAIYNVKPRDVQDAADAALGLKPFGPYTYILFAAGLLGQSVAGSGHAFDLHVRVEPGWRERPVFLNALDWRAMAGEDA